MGKLKRYLLLFSKPKCPAKWYVVQTICQGGKNNYRVASNNIIYMSTSFGISHERILTNKTLCYKITETSIGLFHISIHMGHQIPNNFIPGFRI